jgi:hypothetical protein
LGAGLLAVVMVVVALYVRGRIDDDGNGSGSSSSHVVRLRCSTELEAACTRLADHDANVDVTVEDAGVTADALVAVPDAARRRVGFDAWLVPAPWPGVVDVRRQVNGLEPIFETTTSPIARSPLVLVVRSDRNAVLQSTPQCGGAVTWKCLGQVAGQPWDAIGGQTQWGRVRPGHSDPTRSATGLLVLSQATSEFLANEQYSRFDLQDNDDYGDWLTGLEQAVPATARTSASPFLDLLQQPAFDAVGTIEAEAGPALARAARDRRSQLTLLYPEPVITANVVLATVAGAPGGAAVDDLAASDALHESLAQAGWRVAGQPRAEGVRVTPALRPVSGLPDAGVLVALQDTWRGTVG